MKKVLALMLAAIRLLTLVACGDGNDPAPQADTPPKKDTSAQEAPTGDLATKDFEVVEAESYRKTVTIAQAAQITTLDPGLVSNVQHYYLFHMVYNTLLTYDNNAKVISEQLATSAEWADDTYTKIKITLRDDVAFHNGEKLTAEDVAFSLGRSTSSLVSASYDHCDIEDDYHFTIVLSKPNVDFMYVLCHDSSAIVCKKAVEADPDLGARFGSGPWVIDMDRYVAGDTIVLVRNDNYWGELPKTEEVVMRIIANASSRLIALENGEVDLMTSINPIEEDSARADENIEVYSFDTAQMYYFAFNNTNGPAADNLLLRQAIAYAINREDLYLATGDPSASPATSFWGWHMASYSNEFELDLSYNPEKAKELVAQIGGTPTLRLMANTTNNDYKVMAEVIQEQCRQVGITIIIDEVDSAGATANSKFASATHEAMIYSINMNDWDSDMTRLLSPGSNTNKAVLNDEHVIELLNKGCATTDQAVRFDAYKELQIYIHDNCFYIPLYYTSDTVAYAKGVSGMLISYSKDHDYSYICIPE